MNWIWGLVRGIRKGKSNIQQKETGKRRIPSHGWHGTWIRLHVQSLALPALSQPALTFIYGGAEYRRPGPAARAVLSAGCHIAAGTLGLLPLHSMTRSCHNKPVFPHLLLFLLLPSPRAQGTKLRGQCQGAHGTGQEERAAMPLWTVQPWVGDLQRSPQPQNTVLSNSFNNICPGNKQGIPQIFVLGCVIFDFLFFFKEELKYWTQQTVTWNISRVGFFCKTQRKESKCFPKTSSSSTSSMQTGPLFFKQMLVVVFNLSVA